MDAIRTHVSAVLLIYLLNAGRKAGSCGERLQMSAVRAKWQNGEVVLEGQPDWSEGRQLVVMELQQQEMSDPTEEWSNTPEDIADWLKWYDNLEPLIITDHEQADSQAWLKKMNDYANANREMGIEDIFR
jgi:hypothetical protein